jgi:energy-converting hydrogenase Eha subunit B
MSRSSPRNSPGRADSFLAWAFFIVIHVLAYVPRLPRLLAAEARGGSIRLLGGRGTRLGLLVAALLAGLVIALLTVHLASKWESFG